MLWRTVRSSFCCVGYFVLSRWVVAGSTRLAHFQGHRNGTAPGVQGFAPTLRGTAQMPTGPSNPQGLRRGKERLHGERGRNGRGRHGRDVGSSFSIIAHLPSPVISPRRSTGVGERVCGLRAAAHAQTSSTVPKRHIPPVWPEALAACPLLLEGFAVQGFLTPVGDLSIEGSSVPCLSRREPRQARPDETRRQTRRGGGGGRAARLVVLGPLTAGLLACSPAGR
ncbi:hypothetical protein B0J11DRAFT_571068 [Dendryphion nanum]|uniref:Uncharacterized protein n=1 Tax=Dendryphion nanum TaxID=256645 RepID=A0A9P9DCD6_9PLEO|nr:hypothetical protein B0J11DRAFT_571068 [Dendryphion nanum]